MILVLEGNAISQKNAKTIAINRKTGRPFIMSQGKNQAWKKAAVLSLRKQFEGYRITEYPITLRLVFYFDTLRRRDLDNVSAAILDSLVQAGVLEDDNTKFVNRLVLEYGGVDKENPRSEIHIEE